MSLLVFSFDSNGLFSAFSRPQIEKNSTCKERKSVMHPKEPAQQAYPKLSQEDQDFNTLLNRYYGLKPRHGLLPGLSLDQVAGVFTFGSVFYGEEDWKTRETVSSCLDAVGRHLSQHEQGQLNDTYSRQPHLAHAAARLLMALWLMANA